MAQRRMAAESLHHREPRRLFGRLTQALFPPSCPSCREAVATTTGLCAGCWRDTAFLDGAGCQWCSRPIPGAAAHEQGLICDECQRHPPVWQRGRAVFRYEGTGRRLVLALKHGDRQDLVPLLGQWSLRRAAELIQDADLIVPVPLHWRRRLKRRGNQAAELARWVAIAAGKRPTFAPSVLRRTRPTGSQDGKNREQRQANLAGALTARLPATVAGQAPRVLLIDDVLTTGATLNAAATALKAAGAGVIDILVLALVMRDEAAYICGPTEHADLFSTQQEPPP